MAYLTEGEQQTQMQAMANALATFINSRGTEEEKARFNAAGGTEITHCPVSADGKQQAGLTDIGFSTDSVSPETLQKFANYVNEHYPSKQGEQAVSLTDYKKTVEGVKNYEPPGHSSLILDSAVVEGITNRYSNIETLHADLQQGQARAGLDAVLRETGIDPQNVNIAVNHGMGPYKDNAIVTVTMKGELSQDQQFQLMDAMVAAGIMTEEQANGQTNGRDNISEVNGGLMFIADAATASRAVNTLQSKGSEVQQTQQQQTEVAPNHLGTAQLGDFSPPNIGDGGHTAGMEFHR